QFLAVSLESRKLLEGVARMRPRRTDDFHGLLHAINRRTAQLPASRGTVSLACTTTFLTADGDRWESFNYDDSGERRSAPIYPAVNQSRDVMLGTMPSQPRLFPIWLGTQKQTPLAKSSKR